MIFFEFIKASKFFPTYAPGIKNWKHKLRGIDGNGKKIDFNENEKMQIENGLKIFANDIRKITLK